MDIDPSLTVDMYDNCCIFGNTLYSLHDVLKYPWQLHESNLFTRKLRYLFEDLDKIIRKVSIKFV